MTRLEQFDQYVAEIDDCCKRMRAAYSDDDYDTTLDEIDKIKHLYDQVSNL